MSTPRKKVCAICDSEFEIKSPYTKKYCCYDCKKIADKQNDKNSRIRRRKSYLKNKRIEINRSKEWQKANRKACRKYQMKSKYGLSLEEYDEMSNNQNHVCYLCNNPNLDGKRLCVDHNHKTGKTRKLLCATCNWLVGIIETHDEILKKAAKYIEDNN